MCTPSKFSEKDLRNIATIFGKLTFIMILNIEKTKNCTHSFLDILLLLLLSSESNFLKS